MKFSKSLMAAILAGVVASGYSTDKAYALSNTNTLVGKTRYETAIKISDDGWKTGASSVIIVNDTAIVDAIAVTPFANLKDAPVLLTGKDTLNKNTKEQIKKLGASKAYIIGGTGVISDNVVKELKAQNIQVERIAGATRESTSIEIAKRVSELTNVTEIAVINGYTGLADGVTIASAAGTRNMPIVVCNPNGRTDLISNYVSGNNIKASYLIGGKASVPEVFERMLPNASRLWGATRNETNAAVIGEFYKSDELKNVYVSKNGAANSGHLIDALSVGVLAAKNDSPVLIVSDKLSESQKQVLNTKNFTAVTQVGGAGNEKAFNELVSIQGQKEYTVSDLKQLESSLAIADANDKIVINSSAKSAIQNSSFYIYNEKKINIVFNGAFNGTISLKTPNSSVVNNGIINKLNIKASNSINNADVINAGEIANLNIEKSAAVSFNNKGKIVRLENNSQNAVINNLGSIAVPDSDTGKNIESLIAEINSIPEEVSLSSESKLNEIKSKYNSLSVEQKKLVSNYNKLNLALEKLDKLKVETAENEKISMAVIDKINLLPENISLEEKEKLEAIENEYNSLTEKQKSLVYNSTKLSTLRAQLDELIKEAEEKQKNEAAALNIENAIIDLPAKEALTISDKDIVISVKSDYERSSEAVKNIISVDKIERLNEAYEKMMEIAKAEMDKISSGLVMSSINNLSKNITIGNINEIRNIRQQYEALSAEGKALVNNLDILKSAEDVVQKSLDRIQEVVRKVNVIEKEIITLADKKSVTDARSAFESLTSEEKKYISSVQKSTISGAELEIKRLETIEANASLKEVVELIDKLPNIEDITEAHRIQVEEARRKYNALDDSLKFAVDMTKLIDAEYKIK